MKRQWGHQQTAVVTAWAVLAALTLAPSVARAQDGTIAGTVTDATSLVLPGVTVAARSTVAGGSAQTVFTDGTGTFTFTALPPGTYDVTFTLPGFGTVVRGGVEISAGATATIEVTMAVRLEEQVVVVGSRAQPRSATASAVPVDVISTQEFASQGATDLTDTLRTVVPSFNVNTQPISDAASVVRPANLRNLAPDHNARPGERQAPPPRRGHRLARERRRRRLAGPGPLGHPLDRATAGRGAP